MKRNYRNLFMVGLMAFATCFTGCKKDEGPTLDITVNGSEELAEEIRSTSASFTIKTSDIESVAYLVEEGNVAESTKDAAVVYAEAEADGRVVAVADGSTTINVYSLEGGKEYTVFFVYAKDGALVIKSKVFTTPAYERIITVVETNKDGFKFHINVPDTMNYRWAFTKLEQYNSYKDNWRHTDYGFLMDGKLGKGSQTIEIKHGDCWMYEDDTWSIYPGVPYIVFLAECDSVGELYATFEEEQGGVWGDDDWGVWAPATRAGSATAASGVGEYTEELDPRDNVILGGAYARQIMYADVTQVESQLAVEVVSKTERRATIRVTADENTTYVVAPFTNSEYQMWISYVTERAIPTTILEYYGADAQSGTSEMTTNPQSFPMDVDSTYIFGVVGVYADDASVLSYDTIHVSLQKSNKPAAVVEITPTPGKSDANFVWFNIKSPEKNVHSAQYLMNYTKEFLPMLNQYKEYGMTEADLMNYYGQELEEALIDSINSDEGWNICFTSAEEMESMLMIAAYNEDESASYYTGVSRSGSIPALDRVESSLYEDLKGDWKATVVTQVYAGYDYANRTYIYNNDTTSFVMSLATEPEAAPATFDESVEGYNDILNWFVVENEQTEAEAKELIAGLYEEYNEWQQYYAKKYESQNWIVGRGFQVGSAPEYVSPWDLFVDVEYSAYDVQELFYDYGPKLFFQVSEGDNVQLLSDPSCLSLAPLYTYYSGEYVILGYNPDKAGDVYTGNFPVEVSADKDTVTIKAVVKDGVSYYPAVGYTSYGATISQRVVSDVVLTRATDEEVVASRTCVVKNPVSDNTPNQAKVGARHMRTRLPKTAEGRVAMPKRVELKVVSLSEILKQK